MNDLPNADEFHTVPSGYCKVIVVDDHCALRIAAFIFDKVDLSKLPKVERKVP